MRVVRRFKDGMAVLVGLLENIEKGLVRRLMKGSQKQPWLIVFLIVFLSMNKKKKKKKDEQEKDENYWRVLGGL